MLFHPYMYSISPYTFLGNFSAYLDPMRRQNSVTGDDAVLATKAADMVRALQKTMARSVMHFAKVFVNERTATGGAINGYR
jgi:hypothetical protein